MGMSIVVFCYLSKIQIALDEEIEVERIKQEHIEATLDQYREYAKKCYEEDVKLYQDSIDPISAACGSSSQNIE